MLSFPCFDAVEAGTTDFSVNADHEDRIGDDGTEAEMDGNTSMRPESSDMPLLMDTSWMSSTDGNGCDGLSTKNPKMSDSLLVETGGALEDDFSEFSSSVAAAAGVSGIEVEDDDDDDDDVLSSAQNVSY